MGNISDQLNREDFCRELIGELAQVLEDTVGLEEAEAFVRLVGLKMGEGIFHTLSWGGSRVEP